MRRFLKCGVLIPGLLLFFSPVLAGEEAILKALGDVKAGAEEGVSQVRLVELLGAAKLQVDTLETGVGNACFRAAARRCYKSYALAVSSRGALMENERQRDKYARQAAYGEHHLRDVSLKMAENYGRLVERTRCELPFKWTRGDAELERAHECLTVMRQKRRR